ncbi:SUMF1/EgtB/PvdO family nonheme iron enzyme [Magnetofaba australis]|uniref:Sulfatase-modifying factor enzyme-like domain-containing protein n=1 Tax=Magnetofaba australis IT-1 TaxID=1434232 RepID=A0A1Y2K7H1_9PROT|nr:SUMF1/EgtB/PvdO family nonheme iron enzyme [Magnetofaba australis]OSM04322.1 hypothetical protein MAIT1_05300 [Magnetofaba australis IT-1]
MKLRAILDAAPDHEGAHSLLQEIAEDLTRRSREALDVGDAQSAIRHVLNAQAALPTSDTVANTRDLVDARYPDQLARAKQARIDDLLQQAQANQANNRLTRPMERNALYRYRQVLAIDPTNIAARQGLGQIIAQLNALAGRPGVGPREARALRQSARFISAAYPGLEEAAKQRYAPPAAPTNDAPRMADAAQAEAADPVTTLLEQAESMLQQDYLTQPANDNAVSRYEEALRLDPGNPRALDGLTRVKNRLLALADATGSPSRAGQLRQRARMVEALTAVAPDALRDDEMAAAPPMPDDEGEPVEQEPPAATAPADPRTSALLTQAESLLMRDRLTQPPQENALQRFHQALERDPGNAQAIAGIERVKARLLLLSKQSLDPQRALILRQRAEQIDLPNAPQQPAAAAPAKAPAWISVLLRQADADLQADRLTRPEKHNALFRYRQILAADPDNPDALSGLARIVGRLSDLAQNESDRDKAMQYLDSAASILPGDPRIAVAYRQLAGIPSAPAAAPVAPPAPAPPQRFDALLAQAQANLAKDRLTTPEDDNALEKYERILAQQADNAAARAGIEQIIGRLLEIAKKSAHRPQRRDLLRNKARLIAERHQMSAQFGFAAAKPTPRQQQSNRAALVPSAPAGDMDQFWTEASTGMQFARVPGGCFQMGSTQGEADERPVHQTCVNGFWMGRYEVTQGQWESVMESRNNPSKFKQGPFYPVENISWMDAQEFIQKLNAKTGQQFRLPTEAEWEYACRSGGKQQTWSGPLPATSVAWFKQSPYESGATHPVGRKQPNGLGLYDMSGNVYEWVSDRYQADFYAHAPRDNPINNSSDSAYQALRGGSWENEARHVRCANRDWLKPNHWLDLIGLRLVRPL